MEELPRSAPSRPLARACSAQDASPSAHAKELFLSALTRKPGLRQAFLDEACPADTDVRQRVEALLAAHEKADQVLEGVAEQAAVDRVDLRPGEVVGPYRLGPVIGEGGFGRVFAAEQLEPVQRKVALKIIKLGMDTREVIARFEAERQTLTLMDHPHITRVLQAGATDSGRPYFAMEFVAGETVTDYCRRRSLGLREMLELFRSVCLAIQHAHTKGVLHRDIKPSNVMVADVDGVPQPRIIDFGVAKAIEGAVSAEGTLTGQGRIVGTPAYMSPEQAGADPDIDTRSDVYALGVLLFELLAGRTPFVVRSGVPFGFSDIQRQILEEDPPAPSAARRERGEDETHEPVPAELDWIVLRCLEKDRERRYPAAGALARDIERYLTHEPIDAAPPSKSYRLRKLVRRHRAATIAFAGVTLALVAGATGTASGWARAARANRQLALEAAESRLQAEIARTVNDFLTEDLLSAVQPDGEDRGGWDVPMSEVLAAAGERLDAAAAPDGRLADAPRVEASIRMALGTTYASMGRSIEALPHLERAHELLAADVEPVAGELVRCRTALAHTMMRMGSYAEAEAIIRASLPELRREANDDDGVLSAFGTLAATARLQGRYDESAALYTEALELARETRGADDDPITLSLMGGFAITEDRRGHPREAEYLFRRSLEGQRHLLGAHHPDTLVSLVNLGAFLRGQRDFDRAMVLLQEAVETSECLLGPDHPATQKSRVNVAGVLREQGELDAAEELYRAVLKHYRERYGPDHLDTLHAIEGLASVLEDRGEFPRAELLLRDALERSEVVHGSGHPRTVGKRKSLARCVYYQRRFDEARTLFGEVLAQEEAVLGPEHPSAILTLVNLATLDSMIDHADRAERGFLEACERAQRLPLGDPTALATCTSLANLYDMQQRWPEAEALLSKVHTGLLGAFEADDPRVAAIDEQLAGVRRRMRTEALALAPEAARHDR